MTHKKQTMKQPDKVQELAKKLQDKWAHDHKDWRTPVWGYFRDKAERILDGREPNAQEKPITDNSNWKEIEEEFRKKFPFVIIDWKEGEKATDKMQEILKFFKPYFQEILHDKAVEELEGVVEKPELFSYDDEYLQTECKKCMNLENGSIVMVSKDNHCLACGRKVGGFCG